MGRSIWRSSIKDLVTAALCVSLGVVLPILLHSIPNAGSVLLPMHLPVLLCGLLCGPTSGLLCGLCTPLLSSLMTGMPGAAYLPAMLCELAAYGLLSGLFVRILPKKKPLVSLYASLILSMLGGRVFYGIVNALVFRAGNYSITLWLTASFVTALPGILVQLFLLPPVALALERVRK